MVNSQTSYVDLIENLATGNVAAFVGAGLSVGAGLPSWYSLISELAERIHYELPPQKWVTGDTLIDAAQEYINQRGLHSLIMFLKERLDSTGIHPSAAHDALARLPISTVFTANYDDLLERAYHNVGKRVQMVVSDSSIAFMRREPGIVNIIKLYGDLDQPTTIVLAREQYESFFLQRPQMVKLLETELARADMMYLGWSHTDPHFNQIFGELLARYGQLMRRGYAAMVDTPEAQLAEMRRKGITVVDFLPDGDRTAQLASWLNHLAPQSAGAVPPKGDEEPQPEPICGSGKRWAVLVGINTYEDKHFYGALQVCGKDGEAIREQLVNGGFEPERIHLLTDHTPDLPTRANILVALQAVADATEPDDLLLFYFSGHGDQTGGESYLVARDSRHLVLKDTAVPLARVKQILESAAARAKVILLDACHAGANIGQKGPKPMSADFIQRVFTEAEGLAILASCKQAQLSYEWRAQERSVFTHYLLEALHGAGDRDTKGFVTVQDASRHVIDGVKLWASQHNVSQTPTLQYTVAGDIVLTYQGEAQV